MPRAADWRTLELRKGGGGKAVLAPPAGWARPAAQPLHFRLILPLSGVRPRALVGVLFLLSGALPLFAQQRMVNSSLVLQVRPEEVLQSQDGSVKLKIRLAPGTTASLWAAESCASPAAAAQIIAVSGVYSLPLSSFAPAPGNSSPSALRVCLASSDGALKDSLPAPFSGTGYAAPASGATPQLALDGISWDLPAGWVVTTQGNVTTWSAP